MTHFSDNNMIYVWKNGQYWSKNTEGDNEWKKESANLTDLNKERILTSVTTIGFDSSFHLLKLYADR